MLSSSFHKFLVHNFQELDATDVQHMSLCWDCSQRLLQGPQSRCGKSSPTVHGSHQCQCQTVQLRKWIDSSFAHFVCVNKTVKLRQNNNRNKTKQKLQQQCFAASVYQTHMGLSCWALYRLNEAGSSSAHQWNNYTGFGNKAVWMPWNRVTLVNSILTVCSAHK